MIEYKEKFEYNCYRERYSYSDVDIVGSEYYDYSSTKNGDILDLVQEPDNAEDEYAVAVYCNENKIGYMRKGRIRDMVFDFYKRGDFIRGRLWSNDPGNAKMAVMFYIKRLPFRNYKNKDENGKSYRLIGNRNEDMQSNISNFEVNKECKIEYDFDKEKYLVKDLDYDLEIGYLPEKFTEDFDDDDIQTILGVSVVNLIPFISNIKEDANGNYSVKVDIFKARTVPADDNDAEEYANAIIEHYKKSAERKKEIQNSLLSVKSNTAYQHSDKIPDDDKASSEYVPQNTQNPTIDVIDEIKKAESQNNIEENAPENKIYTTVQPPEIDFNSSNQNSSINVNDNIASEPDKVSWDDKIWDFIKRLFKPEYKANQNYVYGPGAKRGAYNASQFQPNIIVQNTNINNNIIRGGRRRYSALFDLIMIFLTGGLWLIWMVLRPKYY